MQETRDLGSILGLGSLLEEGMATHSSILAWKIPWPCCLFLRGAVLQSSVEPLTYLHRVTSWEDTGAAGLALEAHSLGTLKKTLEQPTPR